MVSLLSTHSNDLVLLEEELTTEVKRSSWAPLYRVALVGIMPLVELWLLVC